MSAKRITAILLGSLVTGLASTAVAYQIESASRLPSAAGLTSSQDSPQTLLQQAIVTIESRSSVVARVRQSARLFDEELLGSGIYLEQSSAAGLQFRLELKVQAAAGSEPATLLRVCDGRYLWTYRLLHGAEHLSRIDVGRIAQGLEEVGRMPRPGVIGDWPGLGGLPKLLRGLNASFDFTGAQPVQLRDQLPAWRLCGVWKPDRLAAMLPDQQAAIREGKRIDVNKLSPHLPTSVVLFLGRDDLFPYRAEYRRGGETIGSAETAGNRIAEGRAGQGGDGDILVAIDWFEVQFNVPIQPARFLCNPGTRPFSDDTRVLLQRFGLK